MTNPITSGIVHIPPAPFAPVHFEVEGRRWRFVEGDGGNTCPCCDPVHSHFREVDDGTWWPARKEPGKRVDIWDPQWDEMVAACMVANPGTHEDGFV